MNTEDRQSVTAAADALKRVSDSPPADGQPLCARCTWCVAFKRRTPAGVAGEWELWCRMMTRMMPPDLVECTMFADRVKPTLDQMMEQALPVDSRKGIADDSYR